MTLKTSIKSYLRVGKHSETLLINQLSQLRQSNNQQVYKFGFGQSPFPIPQQITNELALASKRKEYMSVQGHQPLREAIANFHGELENKQWTPEQILIGTGSKILLYCVMAAFQQAEVLLPAPSWVSYEPQARLAGHKVSWLTTDFFYQWKITPKQLEKFCESRRSKDLPLILVLNYPSNPSGQNYSRPELIALADIMRRYNIIVIADEIYSLLNFESHYSTLDQFYPEGCIVSSGLSKWCGAGGWRLGFHHIPKQLGNEFFQAVISVASETYSCAPSPIQIAATHAYQNHPLAKEFLLRQRALLKTIGNYCSNHLRIAGIKVHDAVGGFYLFPDFAPFKDKLKRINITTGEQLTSAIMEQTGVALLPGSAFGMPLESLTTRLAFVDFDGFQIWEAENNEPEFERVKSGISILCDWLLKI